ncbi:ABC-type transport system involved in Fe-S cluster assembly, permease component (plasmid) [Sinorhizobium sojae CCBAU 05684]|uniref:ABC-type transport system involved in Fe-S cluster assembly, permease component n=2 Tax=Sinorhizobium sojae TaxID=716925 RepID=A0A249PKM8_9HYPH|nr:ABC-type transport system involved in Fe-S cluster assembly, permease component [Sinorhizobium sojae CCBAU 05684]
MDWPRLSDDRNIFHDTDEEIGETARLDIDTLEEDGFHVSIDVNIYGCVEARVSRFADSTLIQWMSETRMRFFPLIRDEEWGARLHPLDLAVNKVIAASTRKKARDYIDLLSIEENLSPLGPLLIAAAGKPPHFSPVKTIEEIRRKALSVTDDEYLSVRGIPQDWTPAFVRQAMSEALDRAESYVRSAPPDIVGLIALDAAGRAVEIDDHRLRGITLRRATNEPEVMPDFPEVRPDWKR